MFDAVGKMRENALTSKFAGAICPTDDLFPRQFGFRAERSTVDAVMEIVDAIHGA